MINSVQIVRRLAAAGGIALLVAIIAITGCAPATEPPAAPAGTAITPSNAATPAPVSPSPIPSPTPDAAVAASDKARVTAPDATAAEVQLLVDGNNAFAFDLYHALGANAAAGNRFVSPYSVSQALAMAYAGAAGDTAAAMAETLRFQLPPERLHPAFNALDLELAARSQSAPGSGVILPELNIANALWGQEGHRFRQQYLDLLAENYGADLRLADFTEPAGRRHAAGVINQWVNDETRGKIPAVVGEDNFAPCQPPQQPCTRLLIASAIYFKGQWADDYDFHENLTMDDYFHRPDGSRILTPMMRNLKYFAYSESESYQAIELPYAGHQLAMAVILPRPGKFDEFTASLDGPGVAEIISNLDWQYVILTLPRFRLEKPADIAAALESMGLADAFNDEAADFSGIAGVPCPELPRLLPDECLYIDDIFQRAFVEVNEKGTEAAAVTTIQMRAWPASIPPTPPPPIVMTVDRPFLFLLRDRVTNTILFIGQVTDPGAQE